MDEKMLEQLPMAEKLQFFNLIKYYVEQYNFFIKKYSTKDDLPSIADNFNRIADESIQKAKKRSPYKDISCKKGCGNCCRINVDITKEEAFLILTICKDDDINISWSRLKRQKNYTSDTIHKQLKDHRKCVFLSDTDECKIYKYRPMACRKMLSLDDPKNCDLDNGLKVIKKFVDLNTEALIIALWEASEMSGSLPRMLLKYRHEI